MKSLEIQQEKINDKPIYIFEDHSLAFKVWYELKKQKGLLPYVISLDHHTDTMDALRFFASCERNRDRANPSYNESYLEKIQKEHLYPVDLEDRDAMNCLVIKLNHDEHIDAAIKLGIISHSISIQWSDSSGTSSVEEEIWRSKDWRNQVEKVSMLELQELINNPPQYPEPPYNYNLPEDRMFIIGYPNCECPKSPHDEICYKNMYDKALESSFLTKQLEIVGNLQKNINQRGLQPFEFILDIDLDYFHTIKSISPSDKEAFSWLVKNSLAISIAKESICVNMLQFEGENINSEYLLNELLRLISEC
ncbi:hypothetical protein [Acinetobacter sp. CE-15]|uniref:hypothetical protein n=1 Tax=Acinetobacter sp. CE-15 TaxID=3425693 RepID=UPI003DA2B743